MTKTSLSATKSHHVTPHTQTKRPGGAISVVGNDAKRSKYGHQHSSRQHQHNNNDAGDKHQKSAPPPSQQPHNYQAMDLDVDCSSANCGAGLAVVDRLDPSNPVHDHRIQQRRKTIAKGKNTAGYDHYLSQVPKSRRKARSLKTPSTPDVTLDVSVKRWNGLVRAWRKSLHQYDPADLVNSLSTSMTLSTTAGGVGQGDATNNVNTSNSSDSSLESTTAKRPIENMTGVARTPGALSYGVTKKTSSDDHFLPEDESSPISLLSAASCRDLDDAFGDSSSLTKTKTTSGHRRGVAGDVFSTSARKNLKSGATGWGDEDSSDDDDDLL